MRRFPVRRPGGDFLCLLAVTTVAVALRAWNTTGTPFPNDDEGTYLAQAWAVRHGHGLAHYTYWYDHPPLGWIQLAALARVPELLLPDAPSFAQGRYAMLPVAAACAALLHLVARRLGLPRAAAVAASLLHAVSPLAVSLGRQVFLDNFAVVWALAAFALALSPRRALWHHVAAGAAFAAAVLSKETIALLLPALLLALWQGSHRRTRLFSLAGFVSGTLLCLVYPLYAVLKGELLPGRDHVSLLDSVFFQLGGRAGTGSVFAEGSEAGRLVGEWLALDPVLPLAGPVAAVAALAVRQLRPAAVAAVLLTAVGLRPEGYLPRMYVLQVLPFLALVLAGTGWRAARAVAARTRPAVRTRRRLAATLTAAVLLTLGALPWQPGEREVLGLSANSAYGAAADWLRRDHVRDKQRTTVVTDGVLWLDAVAAGFPPGAGTVRDRKAGGPRGPAPDRSGTAPGGGPGGTRTAPGGTDRSGTASGGGPGGAAAAPGATIWHHKLDRDPAVMRTMPRGWRDIDYIVSTPALRNERRKLPTLDAALRHATVVTAFGDGGGRVEILRVGGR